MSLSDFKNENKQEALINKINLIISKVYKGKFNKACNKLQNNVLKRTDGCNNTGAPEKNDWIINCEAQSKVYPVIIEARDLICGDFSLKSSLLLDSLVIKAIENKINNN